MGRRKGTDLIYAGKVDHGFDKHSAAELRKRLPLLFERLRPYSKWIAQKGIWVEPDLLAEVEYRAKSGRRSPRSHVAGREEYRQDAHSRRAPQAETASHILPLATTASPGVSPASTTRVKTSQMMKPLGGGLTLLAGDLMKDIDGQVRPGQRWS